MKKINLFAVTVSSMMMFACTDYEGQITDVYKDDVEPHLDVLVEIAQIHNQFAGNQLIDGALGDLGNFGEIGTLGCGDLWCGATDTEGRIDASKLPFMEEKGGYWFDYNDEFDGGNSKFVWPSDVHEDGYGNFFGPMAEQYGALKGTAVIEGGIAYGFVGLGFDLVNDDQDPADITDFGGFCLQYTSDQAFYVALKPYDEAGYTEYNNYIAYVPPTLPPTYGKFTVDIPWSLFRQETGWGNQVALADFLTRVVAVQLKFITTGDFHIYSIGRYGTCK